MFEPYIFIPPHVRDYMKLQTSLRVKIEEQFSKIKIVESLAQLIVTISTVDTDLLGVKEWARLSLTVPTAID